VRISAVICTHNRLGYARAALSSLLGQSLAPSVFEILVVDNASTDGTFDALSAEFGQAPNLRLLREPRLGLSHARNTGWREAKGEFVAYLDDDAQAAPGWLEAVLAAFALRQPAPGCVAGRILPHWEAPRPAWLSDELALCLAILDWGEAPLVLGPDRHFAGANMAFPRRVIEAAGGFAEFLGRKGGTLLSNEEILLRRHLESQGLATLYAPEALVTHFIQAARLQPGWFTRRSYWQGVSEAVMSRRDQGLGWSQRLRLVLRVLPHFISPPRKLFWMFAPTGDPGRFDLKCAGYGTLGFVSGLLGLEDGTL
jgi:glucosyl-dolichyl phosphate glucuronosyltransferase